MNPRLIQIAEKLKKQYALEIGFVNEEQRIASARLLDGEAAGEKELLYIGSANQFDLVSPPNQGTFLFLCSDEEAEELKVRLADRQGVNWYYVIDGEVSLSTLFNRVQEILEDSQALVRGSAALLNSIIQGRGLTYIMEIASQLLGNPVMLGDNNHRLLAYSWCNDVEDGAWNELRETGYCTYEYTEKYEFKTWVEKSSRSKIPVIGNLGEISRRNRIFAAVTIGDTIVGHFAVLEYRRDFLDKDLEIVSFICELISSEMQRNPQYLNSKNALLEGLILELLHGNSIGTEKLAERVKLMKWKVPSKLYVMAIPYNSYDVTFTLIPFLRESLKHLFTEEEVVFFDSNLILILGCEEGGYLKGQDLNQFEAFLKKNLLKAGVSQEFNNLSELKHRYEQAINAISLGKKVGKEEPLLLYEDYSTYHMIQLAGERHDIADFCHPAVLILRDYDRRHKTEYLKTVYTYAVNMRNLVLTAENLYIHRNTLTYRIAKIQELLGYNLDDEDMMMKIFVSCKLLEYMERI